MLVFEFSYLLPGTQKIINISLLLNSSVRLSGLIIITSIALLPVHVVLVQLSQYLLLFLLSHVFADHCFPRLESFISALGFDGGHDPATVEDRAQVTINDEVETVPSR